MASLADLPELVGFFSYSREDDQGSRGSLSALRDAIQNELSAQLGRSQSDFRVWQDKAAISLGTLWEKEIAQGIAQSVFFIPIVTPRALRSQHCAFEFNAFLKREAELGRDDLVFPILYIPVPALEDEKLWRDDPVLKAVGTRQYLDWRELRHHDLNSVEVRQRLERFCRNVTSALHKAWISPEERQRQAEAEARQQSDEERRRKAALAAAEQRAQAERARKDAEAARRTEEAERSKLAAAEARQRAEEERRRVKAAAEQREREEREFRAVKQGHSAAAVEAFLAAFPRSHFGAEAQLLQTALLKREEAFARASTSQDPSVLKAFRDTYKKGADVDQIRERLRLVVPQEARQGPSLALVVPAALAALVVAAAGVWWAMRPATTTHQAAMQAPVAAPPSPAIVAAMPTKTPPPAAPPAPSAPAPEQKITVADSAPAVARPSPPLTPLPANDVDAWSVVKDSSDTALLHRFTAKFPDSFLRPAAEARIAALVAVRAAWDLMKDSKDPDQLRQFIRQFPDTSERVAAEQRLAALGAPLAAPAPTAQIPAPPTPVAPAAVAPAPIPAVPAPLPTATAALTPPASPTLDPHELARALQFELMRVGCFDGKVTGEFDDDTKVAWHKFIKRTDKDFPDTASPDAIKAVRSFDKRVCPLVCPHGEHAEDDVCVANEAPAPKHTVKREERETGPAPAATAPAQGGGCLPDRNAYRSQTGASAGGC
ncbi:MAG: toll/interleukin-1 receptor domain-containing protein [Xanthobacteraceae bacterium]